MKLVMIPQPQHLSGDDGIRRVVEAYWRYLPQFGVELLHHEARDYDVKAVHAGMSAGDCTVAHLHGMYWTADYPATAWEFKANRNIVEAIRKAKEVTVPSAWVTETFQRDMRFTPHIIPHGIEWQEWQHQEANEGYVLWNKTRAFFDVCNPNSLADLARVFPNVLFKTTFAPKMSHMLHNIMEIGTMPHQQMKTVIQLAGIYLSTTKETFGIGTLEAMASGVPVLGWRHGGNCDLVEHGVNGYLAQPGNMEDLANGLDYCLKYQDELGANGREMAKQWTWYEAITKLMEVYRLAMVKEAPTVGVVIPVYNKPTEQLKRAIDSYLTQTRPVDKIVVVNDGSQPENSAQYRDLTQSYDSEIIHYVEQNNQGVANARNNGIALCDTKYICCNDADDWSEPLLIERCIKALEDDSNLGLAYGRLKFHNTDGRVMDSKWPSDWDFDRQVNYTGRLNQVPTCCVFRRKVWERLGGYRQRYAPDGAGAEDAEFWTRIGAYGWRCAKVTDEFLFNYQGGGAVSGDRQYHEADWLYWHPWAQDNEHPLASWATPRNSLMSHPVRQYDEPIVSVVIPIGKGHERTVIDALDSLEGQTFRKWEAIVVWDSPDETFLNETLLLAYPHIKLVKVGPGAGPGVARNRGVELARAPILLFLDADDAILPPFLKECLEAWNQTKSGIYTDYESQAYIEPEMARELEQAGRLAMYDERTGRAIINHQAFDFDCERAIAQPTDSTQIYIWNNITTLFPTAWHFEIGGFDEQMETWEDWDYWLRMAKAGKCFFRLNKRLMRYRMYTGERRYKGASDTETGRQFGQSMLQYIRGKDIPVMTGCKNCPGGRSRPTFSPAPMMQSTATSMGSDAFRRCIYTGKGGSHHVYGVARFAHEFPGRSMRRRDNGFGFWYGYIGRGAVVEAVHVDDIKAMPGRWQIIEERVEMPRSPAPPALQEPPRIEAREIQAQTVPPLPPEPPKLAAFNLETLPGVTPKIANGMRDIGLDNKEAILTAGLDGLVQIKGVAEKRAKLILGYLEKT